MPFRFGVNVGSNAPIDVLRRRWKLVEELGFDSLWVPDHTASFAGGGAIPCYDGWTILTAAACHTTTIRVGTMVSNPALRPPAILAKQALAVDAVSGGRLELGMGTGIAQFDYDAVGEPNLGARERIARFAEYLGVVASILESPEPVTFDGTYYKAVTLRSPQATQAPRTPITVGGQARKLIELAARYADRWNTHGPAGATLDEILEKSARQSVELDDLARSHDREPSMITRSLMGVQALDVWTQEVSLQEICHRARPLGFTEFVLGWPGEDRLGDLERLALDVLPQLRRL